MKTRFWCKLDDLWKDSWTYGSWRQYICKRPGGQTQCARISSFHLWPWPIFGHWLMAAVGPLNVGNHRVLPGEAK